MHICFPLARFNRGLYSCILTGFPVYFITLQPQNVQYARLSDHFDLEFTTLPHKRYHPEKFNEEAINLRGRFIDE